VEATGRRANVEALGLADAGVELDGRGYVRTDYRLRTSAPGIWAAGDVAGRFQFTHMAEHEARSVLAQALFRLPFGPSYRVVPWATFTDPEVGRVGLSEEQARQEGRSVSVWRFPLSQVDRAVTDGESLGFSKILTDSRSGRILGGVVVAPHGGELIQELTLAMERGLTPAQISRTIHVYPTLSLGVRRAADNYAIEHAVPPWLLWLARRVFGYDTRRRPGAAVHGETPAGP
jgi:pyruvate/2-oxoglutarate dehydrogenase complex dihydrolipoamide dehydrogenase (E3) component